MEQSTEYWNVQQAAGALDVNYKTLYRQLNTRGPILNGIAIAVQINHVWRCLPEAIARVRRGETGDDQSKAA